MSVCNPYLPIFKHKRIIHISNTNPSFSLLKAFNALNDYFSLAPSHVNNFIINYIVDKITVFDHKLS